jgi:hypothetical protein
MKRFMWKITDNNDNDSAAADVADDDEEKKVEEERVDEASEDAMGVNYHEGELD